MKTTNNAWCESTKHLKAKLYFLNARAKSLSCAGRISQKELANWFNRWPRRCLACGSTDRRVTIDHVRPLYLRGPNHIENLQPLCEGCNAAKGLIILDYRVRGLLPAPIIVEGEN